eukprot:scaffold1130_cov195-Pinguiococcus_pyrenoidosus.AAC.50
MTHIARMSLRTLVGCFSRSVYLPNQGSYCVVEFGTSSASLTAVDEAVAGVVEAAHDDVLARAVDHLVLLGMRAEMHIVSARGGGAGPVETSAARSSRFYAPQRVDAPRIRDEEIRRSRGTRHGTEDSLSASRLLHSSADTTGTPAFPWRGGDAAQHRTPELSAKPKTDLQERSGPITGSAEIQPSTKNNSPRREKLNPGENREDINLNTRQADGGGQGQLGSFREVRARLRRGGQVRKRGGSVEGQDRASKSTRVEKLQRKSLSGASGDVPEGIRGILPRQQEPLLTLIEIKIPRRLRERLPSRRLRRFDLEGPAPSPPNFLPSPTASPRKPLDRRKALVGQQQGSAARRKSPRPSGTAPS